MKKIFTIILSSLVLMASCNEEIEENWNADSLTISCESLEDAGSGNLKMTLPTEFSGKLSLNIESNSPWQAEVGDITIQKEQWITLSSAGGEGNGTLDINIAPNHSAIDRIGSVIIKTSGNIPVRKAVTLIQGNTDDMLSIGFDEVKLPEGVMVEEGLSGSWSMVLPKDFDVAEQISVAIFSTVEPNVEISYPEGLPQGWLQSGVSVLDVPEAHVVSFAVTENESNEYREALVTFTSRAGEVEVKKMLTVSQLGDEDVIWTGDYFQGSLDELEKAEIILPSTMLQDIKIADLKNITGSNIELPEQEDNDWLAVSINENNEVLISTIKENTATNKENVKELVLKSKLSGEEFKVTVRQCMQGYGIILDKNLWNVEVEGCTVYDEGAAKLEALYDNKWSDTSNKMLFVQLKQSGLSEDCVIIIDLGENHEKYNAVGLMPRLQWTQPSPGKITVEVCENKETGWIKKVDNQDYYADSDLKPDGSDYESYDGIIKWAKLGECSERYIKITMPYNSSFWSDKTFLSFDEIFVTWLPSE